MLISLKKHMAYVCPYCSTVNDKEITPFTFSVAKTLSFSCMEKQCGETCLTMRKKDNKYLMNIECPICGETHSYSISYRRFWNSKLFIAKCPIFDSNIFFNGSNEEINNAVNEFHAMIDEGDDESIDIFSNMMELIYQLTAEKLVSCSCGCHDIKLSATDESIILTCKKCHNHKSLKIDQSGLDLLENASSLIL